MIPFSAKDLVEKGIELDSNLFNYTTFQQLDSPYYTLNKLITFSTRFWKDCFSIFHLNDTSMNKNCENMKDLIVSQTNPFKVVVLTVAWLADKKVCNSSFFNILSFLQFIEIISQNYFCVRHKNRRNCNQHFKLLFFELNSHLGSSS